MADASLSAVLATLLERRDLDQQQAAAVMGTIMSGEAEPSQIAALLVALRAKGESPSEIAGFVEAMLDAAEPIEVDGAALVDTCGTGGDDAGTFNISTLSSLVVAAAGQPVAKHGNRAASGTCGSADLLEALGVVIDLPPAGVAATIAELGIGFLYARSFHPAMRFVAPVRAQLGVPTVFNVLGPLSNPARVAHQVVGVADRALGPIMAEALARLGAPHALVFRGRDGLDELTTTGPSEVWEVRDGEVETFELEPESLGVPRTELAALIGGGVDDNVATARRVLAGEPGPQADVVALNAAAALYVTGRVADLRAGVELARETLQGSAPAELLERWVARSQQLAD